MEALQKKCNDLQNQVTHLFHRIGTSTDGLFASQNHVMQLEEHITNQQSVLENLQQKYSFFTKNVPDYLNEQLQQAMAQRGSRGLDYLNITKFITAQLASTTSILQDSCTKILQESIPLKKIQDLEKKILTVSRALPTGAATVTNSELNPETNSAIHPDLHTVLESIQNRLSLLEQTSVKQQHQQQHQQQEQQHEQQNEQQPKKSQELNESKSHQTTDYESLDTIKQHIHHLEDKLLLEVQRAYQTVYNPGEYGAPLASLQATVATLNRDFQSFRAFDTQKSMEKMVLTAHQNLRQEFRDDLDTRISKDDYKDFQDGLKRIEDSSNDVRNGFYKMKNRYEEFEKQLSEKYSDTHWDMILHVKENVSMIAEEKIILAQTMKKLHILYDSLDKKMVQQEALVKEQEIKQRQIDANMKQSQDILSYLRRLHTQMEHSKTTLYRQNQEQLYQAIEVISQQYKQQMQKQQMLHKESGQILQNQLIYLKESLHKHKNTMQEQQNQITESLSQEYKTQLQKQQHSYKESHNLLQTQMLYLKDSIQKQKQNMQEQQSHIKESLSQEYKNQNNKQQNLYQETHQSLQTQMVYLKDSLEKQNIQEQQRIQLESEILYVQSQLNKYESDFNFLGFENTGNTTLALPRYIQSSHQNQSMYQMKNPITDYYNSITKCFYTAILGKEGQEVDSLGKVEHIPGWDYICFTNQKITNTNGWKIQTVSYTGKSPSTEAKRYKWLSHQELLEYDLVVWIDGYITPNPRKEHCLKEWIHMMNEKQIHILHRPHDTRNCIWEECDAVVKAKRDTSEHVGLVKALLKKDSMPRNWGLFDTNILFRFHKNLTVQQLGEEIYTQLYKLSNRDQLAVTYIYYKNKYNEYAAENLMDAFQKNGTHIRIAV
jgi:hypothetical protein